MNKRLLIHRPFLYGPFANPPQPLGLRSVAYSPAFYRAKRFAWPVRARFNRVDDRRLLYAADH
jgi:hypothetical protein